MAKLNPYLNFRNTAREAMEFYKSVLGGELQIMTFGQGGQSRDPGEADKVMHGQLETPSGFTLMGSDVPASMPHNPGTNFAVSISGTEEAELRSYWDGLSAGATIIEPLVKAPWGDRFGMLADRFGITWMVNITAPRS